MVQSKTFSELLRPSRITPHKRKPADLNATGLANRKSRTARFETRVFRFLRSKKHSLGIRDVRRFRNALIDGGVILRDGRGIAVEVKYRLSWATACRAEWQLDRFMTNRDPKGRWKQGVVIFGAFSADWATVPKRGGMDLGWTNWYMDHARHGRRPQFSILHFTGRVLRSYADERQRVGLRPSKQLG
jgi:hypothetical protein